MGWETQEAFSSVRDPLPRKVPYPSSPLELDPPKFES